jgi:hypothetical protein
LVIAPPGWRVWKLVDNDLVPRDGIALTPFVLGCRVIEGRLKQSVDSIGWHQEAPSNPKRREVSAFRGLVGAALAQAELLARLRYRDDFALHGGLPHALVSSDLMTPHV